MKNLAKKFWTNLNRRGDYDTDIYYKLSWEIKSDFNDELEHIDFYGIMIMDQAERELENEKSRN